MKARIKSIWGECREPSRALMKTRLLFTLQSGLLFWGMDEWLPYRDFETHYRSWGRYKRFFYILLRNRIPCILQPGSLFRRQGLELGVYLFNRIVGAYYISKGRRLLSYVTD